MADDAPESPDPREEFLREAAGPRRSLAGEFVGWLRHNRKWWLAPLLLTLLALGLLVALGSSALGPFVYPFF